METQQCEHEIMSNSIERQIGAPCFRKAQPHLHFPTLLSKLSMEQPTTIKYKKIYFSTRNSILAKIAKWSRKLIQVRTRGLITPHSIRASTQFAKYTQYYYAYLLLILLTEAIISAVW